MQKMKTAHLNKMHCSEFNSVLTNAILLVDTREQLNARFRQRIADTGMEWEKTTIKTGDYSIKTTLPNGEELNLIDKVVIERKMSWDEVASCFTSSRTRFENEFKRAKDKGTKFYLLIENAELDQTYNDMLWKGHSKTRVHRNSVRGSLLAWSARYNITFVFCSQKNSGKMIAEILQKELQEELRRLSDG